jgi:probable O-glycosylation ligase (exosortase A-associated)
MTSTDLSLRLGQPGVAPPTPPAPPPPPRSRRGRRKRSQDSLFANVEWSMALVGFLTYVFVIVSYRIPIGVAAMIVTLIGLVVQRQRLRFPPFLLWAAVFLAWGAVGSSGTAYPATVNLALQDFGKVCIFAFAAVNIIRTRARLRLFIVFFLGVFAYYPVRGALFNYFLYRSTVFGRALWNYVYDNPNDLSAFCLLPLACAIGLLYVERTRWIRYAAMAGAAVIPFLMLLTQSRGGFLGLLVFGAFVFARQMRRLRGMLVALAVVGVVAAAAPDSAWERFRGISKASNTSALNEVDEEGSAEQRYEIWKVARAIIAANPVSGVGLGAYAQAHVIYALEGPFKPTARGRRDAHSTYLRLLAETGVVGLGCFVMIVLSVFVRAERVRRRARRSLQNGSLQLFYLEIGLLSYLVVAIFGSFGTNTFTYLYLALVSACTEVLASEFKVHKRATIAARRAASQTMAEPRLA